MTWWCEYWQIMTRLRAAERDIMGLKESYDALATEVDTIIADIAALKAQIAAGTPITAEQLDALTAKLKAGE